MEARPKIPRPNSGPKRKRSPALWAAIRADVTAGTTVPAAGLKWNVPKETITGRARREGWMRRDIDAAAEAALLAANAAAPAGVPRPLKPPELAALIDKTAAALEAALDAGGGVVEVERYTRAFASLHRLQARGDPAPDPAEAAPVVSDVAWNEQAHDAQRAPEVDWRTWVFLGGRGAGKTRAGAEWLDALARAEDGLRLALVAPTLHDVREVMVAGASGVLNLPRADRPRWETTRRRLVWTNGSTAQAFSAEDPESLRGPQFHGAWADEFCAWRRPGAVLPLLRMGLRLGADPRLAVTTTPKPIPALRRLLAEPGCVVTRSATAANAGALSPVFLDSLRALYGGTRLYAQELEGVVIEGEGALWRAEELARCRGPAPARFDRVVVAVDPPASAGGDACGIVAAARLDQRAYVLEDATAGGLSPLGWARRAAEAARRWGAAVIVAEANQGGDMVRSTLALAGATTPVRLAHAGRSKRARAEPVAALYEQGRVTHCGAFPALEEELMALGAEGGPGEGSPDRADALVWALSELMLGEPRPEPRVRWL